jgi:hypothetical protein
MSRNATTSLSEPSSLALKGFQGAATSTHESPECCAELVFSNRNRAEMQSCNSSCSHVSRPAASSTRLRDIVPTDLPPIAFPNLDAITDVTSRLERPQLGCSTAMAGIGVQVRHHTPNCLSVNAKCQLGHLYPKGSGVRPRSALREAPPVQRGRHALAPTSYQSPI